MTQLETAENREDNPANDSLVGKTRMHEDPVLERVWIDYKETPNPDLKNNLLERYLPIVRYTADRLHMKLPQQVEVEDLYSAGIFGLMDAIDNYDLTRLLLSPGSWFDSRLTPGSGLGSSAGPIHRQQD